MLLKDPLSTLQASGDGDADVPPTPNPPAVRVPLACPYCRATLTTRADGSFFCARCGDFPNYGRPHGIPSR